MIETKSIDTSGLDEFIGAFARVTEISSRDAVNYQTGLLMNDLATQAPPKTLDKANRKANWQVRKSFYAVKRGDDIKQFGGSKPLFKGDQARGEDTVWLYASPTVIVGTPKKFDKTGVSDSQMLSMHKAQQKRSDQRWTQAGTRGHQRVMLVNKPVVKASAAKSFARQVRDSFGKLKASFCKGASIVKANLRVPAFVKKHFSDSKGDFVAVKPGPDVFTVIISQSPGCEHPSLLSIIRGAMKTRAIKLKRDVELFYSGKKNAADFRKAKGFSHFKPSE